jgi:hypothetical protein
LGAHVGIAVELTGECFRNAFIAALQQLSDAGPVRPIDPRRQRRTPKVASEIEQAWVHELRVSMIMAEDVLTKDGKMTIVRKGATLTETLIERISNFRKLRGVQEPIRVRLLEKANADGSSLLV